jgi:hypothetical protein
MYTLLLSSYVLFTLQSVPIAQVLCTNIQPASKLLVTMDLSSSTMIPFLTHSSINTGHPACFSFTFHICALSVVFSASPIALHCGKVDCHHSYCESVHSSCRVSFIVFSHCLNHVRVHCQLVCWAIFLLTVSLSSLEFLPVALSFFLHLNYLSQDKSPNTFLPRRIFPSRFPTMTRLSLLFSTTSISYCAEIFHRTLLLCHGLLWSIFLFAQSFYHCLSDSLCELRHLYLLCREGVTIQYHAHETNIYWHHDNIPKHKKQGDKW